MGRSGATQNLEGALSRLLDHCVPRSLTPHGLSDAATPGIDSKIIDVTNAAANCAGLHPSAFMDLRLLRVRINGLP